MQEYNEKANQIEVDAFERCCNDMIQFLTISMISGPDLVELDQDVIRPNWMYFFIVRDNAWCNGINQYNGDRSWL